MPILSHTHCNDPAQIRAAFLPFARPDWVEGMIIGNDLDSLLSAMFLQEKFGWPVVGVYSQYTRLWHTDAPEVFQEKWQKGKFFALDLDIYHPAMPSLGHHIIARGGADELPGHTHSLNPNALRGFSIEQGFRRKYPLSTIHFLCWLLEQKTLSPGAEMLVWLADSSFVNAQHYRSNVAEWAVFFLRHGQFSDIIPRLQTIDFEQDMQRNILQPLAQTPLARAGNSRYKSVHLGLNGFQCQFENPHTQNTLLQSLCAVLSELSGWRRLDFPQHFAHALVGKRREIRVDALPRHLPFGEWLAREGVFSYAFTFKDRLNYTVL